ncbi:MAG: TRAP transporter large permease subunit [Butyricicoccus pullicaecorum]|nr:TRAP transporter large permease subunit [Butyricicoccus pullicaecorum]
MIVQILGGIISGLFTATEASAVSLVYVVLLDVPFYHKMTLRNVWGALKRTVRSSASIFLIIGFTSIISWILAMQNVPICSTI